MKRKVKSRIKTYFPLCVKDTIFTVLSLAFAMALCMLFRMIDESDIYVSMIFILAVFIISRYTNGYFYGTLASFISVFAVNALYSYPDMTLNLTLSGYPIAIICMLIVSVITSTLTTQIKQHGTIFLEAEKEKTRSNLLRAVSHDLRTPLTSILGASSAIIENDDILTKEERIKLLSEVREDAQWLIRMVENLLSITRIDCESAAAKITKEPEAVEELIGESISKFKKRFPDEVISVKVPGELLMVPMDAVLIEQVVINLLENAVIHSKTATKISLSVYKDSYDAVFEITDNGVGIPEEMLPRIFDGYFKQAFEDESDKKRNMGIGLSVCNTIIRAHYGTMSAQNNAGGGALFRFTLPLNA